MSNRLAVTTSLCFLLFPLVALADVSLPSVFSEHMVLQRKQPIQVWGWASPGEGVKVKLGESSAVTTTGKDGRWQLKLPPMDAGGPLQLTVQAADGPAVVVDDVYVGEVWLCSGQSNMAMNVSRARQADVETAAANHPQIRMFKVASAPNTEPQEKCQGSWSVCSPETVGRFSATAYFFGRKLHRELNVPVGLINSSVGGTSIESWTSMAAQSKVAAIEPRLDAWREQDAAFDAKRATAQYEKAVARWEVQRKKALADGKRAPRKPRVASQPRLDRNYPSNLFNGMIHPIVGYTIRGTIWYQGENASGRGFAQLYQAQLTTLIRDWRHRWGQGDFPFAWVQLPNFRAAQTEPSETTGWVLVQEGMLKTLSEPYTGMAVTIDIGEVNDIHPKNKQDVGSRLAAWALADVYDRRGLAMGPIAFETIFAEGRAVVKFAHAAGLNAAGKPIEGFALAGEDRVFHWAEARLDGDVVVVSCKQVSKPVAVRYAWAQNPKCNLRNGAGIPASPFRSDDWDESQNQ